MSWRAWFAPAQIPLAGITLHLHVSLILLIAVLIGAGIRAGMPLWAIATFLLVLLCSALVHELGHALMLRHHLAKRRAMGHRRVHTDCVRITLHALGGHAGCCPHCASHLSTREMLTVTVAGPCAGFAFALAGYGMMLLSADATTLLIAIQVVFVNVLLSAFNLLPILPLDGGQLLRVLLVCVLPQWLTSLVLAVFGAIACRFLLGIFTWELAPLAYLVTLGLLGFNLLVIAVAILVVVAGPTQSPP